MNPPVILVIDDNPITRKIVRVALQSASYGCCEAEDGQSALALVRRSLPDLVLQDLLLPDMDSFALVKELRAIARDLPIPILACSGSLSRLEQARNIVLGFTDFLPKPIEPSRLLRTIDAYLAAKRDMAGRPGQNRRVIIADDDPVQRKLLKIHLSQLGYQVATAANGRDALAQAVATPPDAIISDILMPELDGFKLCMEVRRNPRLAAIPIILTSVAFIEEADRRLAHNAGANALILRTADFREIIMALQHLMSERATTPQRSRIAATAEELYVHRITRQLERQTSHNEALTRRMKWIEAELGILAGFAETLRNTSAIEAILDEQLHHCLNALGISKGAIYLLDESKAFCLRAQSGYESSKNELQGFFGHGDTLRLALEHRLLLDIPSDEVAAEVAHHLLRLARAKALLIMPLLLGDEQLGALVIASARKETDGDWYTLIRAVGSQVSQAIGLARAISQLREKEERLARIVETVPDGIILIDLNGQVTSANTSAERILGMKAAEMTATRLPFLAQIQTGATIYGAERKFPLAGGSDIFLSINAAPLRDGDGQIMGTVVTLSDITAHKRAEQESQRLDQMKDDFMNVASHEMRTPLTSLLLASRLIQRRVGQGESAGELSQLAEDIITHAKRMNRVIEDMLDMTHITSGQLYIRKERCDICALLRQSIAEQQLAGKHEIVLIGASAPIVGEIDRDRVWQVIANLLSNAIKYSPPALPIEVAVGAGQDGERRWLTVAVRDRGRGIAPEYLPHVFERFYRIANNDPTIAAQQTDGLGLGLFIADAVVKAHGGTITAQSAIGQGSTFTVKLPLSPTPDPSPF